MPAQIFTDSERPDLYDRLDELADPWPEFIHHDDVVNEWWPLLHERFPDFQLVLYDPDADVILGRGCTLPVCWDGHNESLSDGVVDIIGEAFAEGAQANVLCALVAAVDPGSRDAVLSATSSAEWPRPPAGLECLIAPVRPTWKERYPLVPRGYMHWTREDGLPFDPWIRLHSRLGAEILGSRRAPGHQRLGRRVGVVDRMSFPEDGDYVVPGALVPVRFEDGVGRYVEPNVWMRHEPRHRVSEALDAKRLELSRRGAFEDRPARGASRDRAEGDPMRPCPVAT
jgi:hypothetical protein